jgi:hypothetical protein
VREAHPDALIAGPKRRGFQPRAARESPLRSSRSRCSYGGFWIFLQLKEEALRIHVPPEAFTPPLPWAGLRAILIALLAINGAFGWRFRPRVLRVIAAAGDAAHDLSLFAQILARVERERFTSPRLERLRAALELSGQAPSRPLWFGPDACRR